VVGASSSPHIVYNKFSQSRRYFYTVTGLLAGVSCPRECQGPFGNVEIITGTATNLP